MKYNIRDLLTFSQDGNLSAASESVGTKYDEYGRPTETGFVSGLPGNPDASFSFSEVLTRNYYDGYNGTTQLSLTTYPQYQGKVRRSEAKVLGSSSTFLHTTFTYDAYGRVTNTAGNNYLNSGSSTAESVDMTYDWADNLLTQDRTHNPGSGATTGTQNIDFEWQYDHMGRSINYFFYLNSPSNTHLAEYNYNNRDELIERNLHSNYQSSLWAWWQSIDYTYNDLGWLTKINSNSHYSTATAFPTGCSPSLPSPTSPTRVRYPEDNDLFYLELQYDELFSSSNGSITSMSGTAQKGGNISQIAWRARGRDRQSYSFTYDHLSRLKTSSYFDVNNSGTASATNRYNENLTYDIRGNITALGRNGYYSSTCGYGQIDTLTYSYTSNTNRLSSITDNALSSQKMHGFDTGSGGSGYTYDDNGNLISDSYKGISSISYNYLNLPNVVIFSGGDTIEFTYDATGIKLRKTVKQGSTVQYVQDYAGGVEYRKVGTGSKRIEVIYHNEGRYYNLNVETNNTLNWQKEYAIRDHLGNTRLMFTDKNGNNVIDITGTASTNDILQENHYYGFGLSFEGPWLMDDAGRDNPYRYNNKELNEDFGLDWYAYGARYYDPVLGRFTGVDPISDQFAELSTYNYASNDPISNIDLHGLQGVKYHDEETNTTTFEVDVIVITGAKGKFYSNYTSNDIPNIQEAFKTVFGGTFENKEGEKFQFSFNVTEKSFSETVTKEKKSGKIKEKEKSTDVGMREIGMLMSENSKTGNDGRTTYPLLLVNQGEVPGTDGGEQGIVTKVDPNAKGGFSAALRHETLHFMLQRYRDSKGSGNNLHHRLNGALGRPFTNPPLNNAILNKLKEFVPDKKK